MEPPVTPTGTRFVIRIPAIGAAQPQPAPEPATELEDHTSTTTGRTIGRRRSRS
jgi:hypothetical protein